MKRRQPEPPAPAAGVPAELLDFQPGDWDDGEPAPDWWGNCPDVSWPKFHARMRYMRACRAWREAHGVDPHERDLPESLIVATDLTDPR